MNETMSLLLVATVLAIGGAGLYIYKFEDEGVQGGGNELSDNYNEDENEEDISEPKTKSKGGKTKRNRKNSSSKRRY